MFHGHLPLPPPHPPRPLNHLRELSAQRLVVNVVVQVLHVQVHALVLGDALRTQLLKPGQEGDCLDKALEAQSGASPETS